MYTLFDVLKDRTVPQARTSVPPMRETKAGRPEFLAYATGPDLADWRRIGTALGFAALPAKKRPDTVDAWVELRRQEQKGAPTPTCGCPIKALGADIRGKHRMSIPTL
ncbi:hypothetical protein [Streptomyces hebeiensis]